MRPRKSETGFTLVDTMVTMAVFGILAAVAVPSLSAVNERMKLGQGQRQVERELQTARLKAVTANRRMRVRFNCPTVGTFRMLEVIGAAADDAADRCSETKYPSIAPDNNPLTRPNHDGPVRYLPRGVSFGATATLEFASDGTVKYQSAGNYIDVPDPDGTALTLTKSGMTDVARITVNRLGKIQLVALPY